MRIERLYRYPVKGLTAEALEEAHVEAGGALPWDRAFALAQGDSGFDPAQPVWMHKSSFMCLLKNARIAALRAAFDPHDRCLTIRAPDGAFVAASPMTPDGRERIAAFLVRYLGEEARGEPRFHHVPGHVFGDSRRPAVSLIALSSLHAFERHVGAPRDLMRFRANIYFSG
ncbi:MAG: MOSC N-terminal beta barrel domain-containing protein, partial [Acetobacteraceae bacterium]|nr:MOSC N-terminal beta barrel domain-containing protein [Acetobacteraceae bacterium]